MTPERQTERVETALDEADLRAYVERYYPDAGYTYELYNAYYRREYAKSVAHGCWPLVARRAS